MDHTDVDQAVRHDAAPAATILDVDGPRAIQLRRALRSGGLRVDGELVQLPTDDATVYAVGRFAVRVEESATTDADLSRRLAALGELHAYGVPLPKPLRPVPLRAGDLRVSVFERVMNEGPARFEQLGQAVRRLHDAPLWCVEGIAATWDPHAAGVELERHEDTLGVEDLQVLLEAIELGAMSVTHPERCCHGALHLGNVLWDPAGPRLVGWSHVGRASALSDLACVAASIAANAPDGDAAEWATAFEAGYGDTLPDPVTVALVLSVRHAELAARELHQRRSGDAHVAHVQKVRELHPVWATW